MRSKPKYQVEPTHIKKGIWERGHIEPWELLRICAWKSAQGLASLSMNDEELIRERTAAACVALEQLHDTDVLATEPDWPHWEDAVRTAVGSKDAATGLLGLSGVGYPVATAILCIMNPKAFPVLDRWAIVGTFGSDVLPLRKYCTAAGYRSYAEALAGRADRRDGASIHELDQDAMHRAMAASSALSPS